MKEVTTEILSIAADLTGSMEKARAWFFSPLPCYDNKTPKELVADGHADAVLNHLRRLEDGDYS